MNDLIRRNDLLELYEGLEGYNIPVDVVIQNIKDMPVAYDVEDVVLTLKEWKDYYENHLEYYGAIENIKAYEHAIEIVKKGERNEEN